MSAPATESEESATAPSAWSHIAAADAAAAAFDYRLANRQHDTDSDTTPSTPDTAEREAFERAIARAVGPLSSMTIAATNGYRPLIRRRSLDPDNVEEVPETPEVSEREAPRHTTGYAVGPPLTNTAPSTPTTSSIEAPRSPSIHGERPFHYILLNMRNREDTRLYARPIGAGLWYRLEASEDESEEDWARSVRDLVAWFDTTFILSTNERRRVVIGLGPVEHDNEVFDSPPPPPTPAPGTYCLAHYSEDDASNASASEDDEIHKLRTDDQVGVISLVSPSSSLPSPTALDYRREDDALAQPPSEDKLGHEEFTTDDRSSAAISTDALSPSPPIPSSTLPSAIGARARTTEQQCKTTDAFVQTTVVGLPVQYATETSTRSVDAASATAQQEAPMLCTTKPTDSGITCPEDGRPSHPPTYARPAMSTLSLPNWPPDERGSVLRDIVITFFNIEHPRIWTRRRADLPGWQEMQDLLRTTTAVPPAFEARMHIAISLAEEDDSDSELSVERTDSDTQSSDAPSSRNPEGPMYGSETRSSTTIETREAEENFAYARGAWEASPPEFDGDVYGEQVPRVLGLRSDDYVQQNCAMTPTIFGNDTQTATIAKLPHKYGVWAEGPSHPLGPTTFIGRKDIRLPEDAKSAIVDDHPAVTNYLLANLSSPHSTSTLQQPFRPLCSPCPTTTTPPRARSSSGRACR
ncbi:hypothetical protein PUNSTDRAFT_139677 [Punctularia strigosozonata HHB-11173 SS5]|uniref:Uncharacterized protein n=1 Tax=Punctularia strigosozonata (strain HHB-11173) TaxID=741275 RepID=R7S0H8_PUNST|nr:uncharacterized protein PUNSTDRAFT_139677 [Punctularia strigosozonata HHB-11173 SS5]EIN03302.1 hypothetical protein PUNSTDRAFT_139677 [Punctularia strigosozonata HHB-11173 SS5]